MTAVAASLREAPIRAAADSALYNVAHRATATEADRLMFLALFLSLVVFVQHFAVRVELESGVFPVLLDDGLIVAALFFPADDLSAFRFLLRRLLHRRRNVGALYRFFLVFLFLRLRHAQRESSADGDGGK